MKDLRGLLNDLPHRVISGTVEGEITELVYDSRKVVPGCMFIALVGASFDGHTFLAEVIDKGAACVVVSSDIGDIDTKGSLVISVGDTRAALALLSCAYFDHPAKEVGVIGITGTKGKTTTTYLIKSVLDHAGLPCGLMGTIETIIGDEHIHALNTTPESYIIQRDLRRMADLGIKYCVMEVSSQGLMMHRTLGIPFIAGIFTNLSPDHIGPNEHRDFEEYIHCKSLLFKQCEAGFFNIDDPHADDMMREATCSITSYGVEKKADVFASDIEFLRVPGALGTRFKVGGRYDMTAEVMLPGYFSVHNALSAICLCKHLGVDNEHLLFALKKARVRGRIELVDVPGDYSVIIDYAHNAMSLESILNTLRAYDPERLVCIFGCGGNRDPERRFQMGEVSGRLSDLTIITSDNPRFEEPGAIMDNIETGLKPTGGEYVKIADRQEAVNYAIKNARPGDVILLAGKGHEDYQEIKGERFHMDERELVMNALSSDA